MRIAIFTDTDCEQVNGLTTTLRAMLRVGRGLEPRIYAASELGIDTPEYFATESFGVDLPRCPDVRLYWPRVAQFARELRAHPPDLIHVTTAGPVGLAARWLAARLRLPLVGSAHAHPGGVTGSIGVVSPESNRIAERYIRWYFGACEALLVPSHASRDRLIDRRYDADRLQVWHRGVDLHRFTPQSRSTAWRAAWHVDDRRPAILFAGRLDRGEGLEIIAPLQRALYRHGVAHQFVFAGDGPMRRDLEERCPDAVFLGALPHDRVGAAMASCDLFLYPTRTDTFGSAVLEAQACGLPVVVADEGGARQQMRPDETGLVCRVADVDSFRDALIKMLRQPHSRAAMGRRARSYAETRDWPQSLEPLITAWRSAASRPSLTGPRPRPTAAFGPARLRAQSWLRAGSRLTAFAPVAPVARVAPAVPTKSWLA